LKSVEHTHLMLSVTGYYPEQARHCPCFIRHKSTLVSPYVLKQNAVPYDKVFISHIVFDLCLVVGYFSV